MRSTMSPTAAATSRQRLSRCADAGAAVAEFVLVSVLLVFLLFAVLQVAALFYVRNIVAASAADGARYAATSDQSAAVGGQRASQRIASSLSSEVADGVPCQGSTGNDP